MTKNFELDVLGKDKRFRFWLLGRMQADCKYFIAHPLAKHLWAGDIEDQLEDMRALWQSFAEDEKPEWLTLEEIEKLGVQMRASKTARPPFPFSMESV